MSSYRQAIQHAFDERMQLNPRYSLRAFARYLGLSPGFLSQVLSGKRGLNQEKASFVFKKLGIPAVQQKLYSLEIQKNHLRSEKTKSQVQKQIESTRQQSEAHLVQQEEFQKISHWSALAILHLLKLKDSPKLNRQEWAAWAAKKLDLQVSLVRSMLETLIELKLVEENRKGLTSAHNTVWTTNQVPSAAIRAFHKQMIEKAGLAVEMQEIEERFLQSIQLPLLKKDLPAIQNDIVKFRNQLLRKYGHGKSGGADGVYGLNFQLFNLLKE